MLLSQNPHISALQGAVLHAPTKSVSPFMKKLRICALIAIAIMGGTALRAADILVPGVVREDFYANKSLNDVLTGTAGTPVTTFLSSFEIPVNFSNSYSDRVSGLFIPPITGEYGFVIATDDNGQLFLSTDDTPAHKVMIAQETVWSGSRTWSTSSAGSATQKNSTTFVDGTGATPFANGIHLIAGNKYYIESDHNEGGGGDNNAVAFFTIDGTYSLPADGDAPNLTGANIGVLIPQPTSLSFTTQPQSQTVPPNQDVHLTATVQTDSQVPATYVWRRSGVVQTNITGNGLSFVATAADSGATFDVIASVPGSLSVTSSVATITVSGTGLALNGLVKQEFWDGKTRQDVENGNVGVPTFVHTLSNFETPTEQGNSFAQRVSGTFTPAATGDYNFIIATDDDSDLFLSTDSSAANKVLIAQEPNWSGVRVWTQDNGNAANYAFKDSSTFIPNNPDGTPGTAPLNPNGIHLIGGNHYYMEGVHHEGGGGDNFAITYYQVGSAIPADGVAPAFVSTELSTATLPGTLTIVTPPHNISVSEGVGTNFAVVATSTGELTPMYQWQFNNGDIAGANGSSFAFTAVASAAGTYSVIVKIPGIATNTVSATLTVQTGVFISGSLREDYYPGKSLSDVLNGTAGVPTQVNLLSSFEIGVNTANNYSDRVSGFFIPAATGEYGFVIATDDNGQLFLSTDDNPANKRMIAQETGYSTSRNWSTSNGGSTAQKNSTTFVDPVAGGTPYANGIHLTAGTKYYIESDHNEGGGGDNNAVAFFTIDGSVSLPADGDPSNLTGSNIGIVVTKATTSISQQPNDASFPQNRRATFTVAATTDSAFAPSYQWLSNGVPIAGATFSRYVTPLLATTGTVKYSVVVNAVGADPLTSRDATVTVAADSAAPVIVSAGTSTAGYIAVKFDEILDAATATTPGNYTLSAGTVNSAQLNNEGTVALLGVSGAPATAGTVTVKNVKDLAGNAIAAAGISAPIFHSTIAGLIDQDIGSAQALNDGTTALTMLPGGAAALSDSEFMVSAGGSDWWGNNDQIHFVGTKVTGDFDEKVQLVNIEPVNRWSKAGLNVRESIDDGAAHDLGVYISPAPVPTIDLADNATGNNLVEAVSRPTQGAAADGTGWQINNIIPFNGPSQAPNADAVGDDTTSQPNLWLRLARVGNDFSGYFGYDGVNWTKYASRHDESFTNTYVGLALTAHNDATYTNTTHIANWTRSTRGGGGGDGSKITITSNANGTITIAWDKPGKLQSATDLKNTATVWNDVAGGGTSPVTITPATTGNLFYRVEATP